MKYFEVNSPYYALVKAEDKDTALLEYNATVAGLDDVEELVEVSRDYALVTFSRGKSEDRKDVPIKEIIKDFNDDEISILSIDGGLL